MATTVGCSTEMFHCMDCCKDTYAIFYLHVKYAYWSLKVYLNIIYLYIRHPVIYMLQKSTRFNLHLMQTLAYLNLSELLQPYTPGHTFRSSGTWLLVDSKLHLSSSLPMLWEAGLLNYFNY